MIQDGQKLIFCRNWKMITGFMELKSLGGNRLLLLLGQIAKKVWKKSVLHK